MWQSKYFYIGLWVIIPEKVEQVTCEELWTHSDDDNEHIKVTQKMFSCTKSSISGSENCNSIVTLHRHM